MFRISRLEFRIFKKQSGQGLIESITAIFVLTTGLSAGLALAIYTFGGSSDIRDRVVATSLAREGVEVTRAMRDSNWLEEADQDNLRDCSFFGSGQKCYDRWLDSTYNISGAQNEGRNYRLIFNPGSSSSKWQADRRNGNESYQLYRQGSGGLSHTASGQPTNFLRKVTVIHQTTGNDRRERQVLVRSVVWWYGKRCNNTLTDLTSLNQTTCRVITEELLTNWRNY